MAFRGADAIHSPQRIFEGHMVARDFVRLDFESGEFRFDPGWPTRLRARRSIQVARLATAANDHAAFSQSLCGDRGALLRRILTGGL